MMIGLTQQQGQQHPQQHEESPLVINVAKKSTANNSKCILLGLMDGQGPPLNLL